MELVTIYTAANIQAAELLRQRLEEAGIAAHVSDVFPHPPGEATDPRILVAAEHAKAARQIALEFEQQLHREDDKLELPEPDPLHIADEGWSEWPLCGNCGARRQTMCPVCNAAGIDFLLADDVERTPRVGEAEPTDDEGVVREVLLMCERCDEAFQPEFYRDCHACGHQHDDGRLTPVTVDADMSPRTVVVLLGLFLLAVGFVVYFWMLFQS